MASDAGQLSTFRAPFRLRVRVYYEDTDAGGVVYHARYLHFMERARTEWLRALGFEQDRLRAEQGILFAVRRADVAFHAPARFNDLLWVEAKVADLGRASLDIAQRVVRAGDDRLCCSATVNVACVQDPRLRPTRIPENILTAIHSEITDGR
jgi:acyl-CoA thioester hydrolase